MAVITYNVARIAALVSTRSEFHNAARSFHGAVNGAAYEITSYNTVVARHTPVEGWVLTGRKYSVTTSKQMGYIRRVLDTLGHEHAVADGAL